MTRRLAALAAMCLAFALTAQSARTDTTDTTNKDIEKRVDEITSAPDYDWLRSREEAGPDLKGRPGDAPHSEGRRSPIGEKADPGCGYEHAKQPPPSPGAQEPPRDNSPGDCGGGAGPTPPSGDRGASCDCGPAFQSCECSRALGGCGCALPGNLGAAVGFVLGGLALAFLVFLVVWLVARRENKIDNAQAGSPVENTAPDEVRLSELPQTPFEQIMRQAEAAARRGDFKAAVGWCYLGGIGALHRSGAIDLRRSTTNLEIIESVRKKQGPHRETARLVRIFEDLYFGDRQPTEAHWLESRRIARQDLG